MTIEMTAPSEIEAKVRRRAAVILGYEVSLIAFDSERNVYVFDVTERQAGVR